MRSSGPTEGPPRRATIKDVAAHAGVSTAAASKVLRRASGVSDAMRVRVESSMAALDYRPLIAARGMRGKTFTIGMVVPDFANQFVSELVDAVTTTARLARYDLLVGPAGASSDSELHIIEALRDHQMDGLVLVSPRSSEERLASIARTTPIVAIGRHGPASDYDTVASDDIAGSRLVVEHLVGLGHTRIAYLRHDEEPGSDPRLPQNVRTDGYRQAMTQLGLADEIDVVPGEWSNEGGRRAAQTLTDRDVLPTALYAGADVAAIGALSALWFAGRRIPQDISVIGYDNTATAMLEPVGLTSVDQFGSRIGALAAELLLERIGGRTAPRHVLVPPELVQRRTTTVPR